MAKLTRVSSELATYADINLRNFLDNMFSDWVQAENYSSLQLAVSTGKNVMYKQSQSVVGQITLSDGQSLVGLGGTITFTSTDACIFVSGNCSIKDVKFSGPAGSFGIKGLPGASNVTIENCKATTCGLLKLYTAAYGTMDWVGKTNISKNILVINPVGVGPNIVNPSYSFMETAYVDGLTIDGGLATDYYYGHFYWGGNSDPAVDGLRANVRKCDNIQLNRFCTKNCYNSGSWGSMAQKVRRYGCVVVRDTLGGDVGIDDEGSVDVINSDCYVSGYGNGNYASFWASTSVQLSNCTSRQYAGRAHFRNYNATASSVNGADVFIDGGNFSTIDPANGFASVDTNSGAARSFNISDLTLVDGVVNLASNNNGACKVDNITLRYTVAGPSTDWYGVSLRSLATHPASVTGITVMNDVAPSSTGHGILLRSSWANGSSLLQASGNTLPLMGIVLLEDGTNASQSGTFFVHDNITPSITKRDEGLKVMKIARGDNNYTRAGVAVPLS